MICERIYLYDDNDKVYDNNYNAVGYFDDNGTFHKC